MERRFRVQSNTRKKRCGKLTYILLIVLFFSTISAAQDKLIITPIAEDLYVYTTYNMYGGKPFPSNSMYLVTSEGVVLFDTPWDTTQFQPLLDSIEKRHNKKVVMCIATHYHADRTAGLEYYKSKGVKTFSSKRTWELCFQHKEKQAESFFEDDTEFKTGKYTFQPYYAGAGHTEDNIVIWFKNQKVLYGGCLVKSTEAKDLGNIADANLTEYPKTIKNLIKRYPNRTYVVPGHFGWDKGALEHTLKLLEK